MTSQNDRRQSSNCKVHNLVMMLILSAFITLNVASAFGVHHVNKLGKQNMGGIRNMPMRKSSGQNIFAHADSLISADDDVSDGDDDGALVFDQGDGEKDTDAAPPIEIICNGTTDGYIVTKLYNVPLTGFPEGDEARSDGSEEETKLPMSLSKIFSPEDVTRLRLEPQNVTLPAALMLLDPEQYPTQSRARKIIRQRSICIIRQNDTTADVSSLNFTELGRVIKRIHPGDIIGVQRRGGSDYYATQGTPYRAPPFEVPVVYEDDHMAIINKPAGILMYRAQGGRGGGGRDTLLSALPYVLTPSNVTDGIEFADENGTQNFPLERPQPVHRLDRPTSGLMVVAKTKVALKHLAQQFEYRKARKTYMAIVNGEPIAHENEEGSSSEWNIIDHDLEEKSAITKWRVIRKSQSLHAKDGQLTLVELKPRTGRYHQLRRHMAWVCKSPLVGDTTYDGADDSALRLRKRGLFLCSNEIELEHPYYNTPFGRKVWIDMCIGKQIDGDTTLWEDADTGMVMIKARTALPDKFESFLEREDSRAIKFGGIYNDKFGETDNADLVGGNIS